MYRFSSSESLNSISIVDHKNLLFPYPRSLARDPRLEGPLRRAQRPPPACFWQEGILDVFFLGFHFSFARSVLPITCILLHQNFIMDSIARYELMII